MKKPLMLYILLLISCQISAQGIEFFPGTWDEAKEKAQSEEKIIFVDAYATWCGPCKRMAKEVFTDDKVGDFYNQAFISMKIDMETPVGRDFAKLFPVSAYPTLFYINEKGELLKRIVGGKNVEQFLTLGQDIAGSYDRSGDLAALYNEGNRDFDIVLKYVKALNNANKSSLKIANDFLRENKNITTDQRAKFIYEAMTSADSRIFSLFINERDVITQQVGEAKVREKIEEACWNTIRNAIDFESESLLTEAKQKMSKHLKDQANNFAYTADYEYAKARADIDLLNTSALLIAKKIAKNDSEKLHDLCNELLLYRSIDASVIESSEKIAKMAVDKSDIPEYLLTYSKILYANNKLGKARKTAYKALERAENPKERKVIKEWIEHIDTE